jgi:hypothetical protein
VEGLVRELIVLKLSLGNVANGGHMKRCAPEPNGAKGKFDRELRAVEPSSTGLAISTADAASLSLLLNSKPDIGNKVGGGAIDKRLGLAPEHVGHRGVGHFNPAICAENDDRVQAAFEYGRHQFLGSEGLDCLME